MYMNVQFIDELMLSLDHDGNLLNAIDLYVLYVFAVTVSYSIFIADERA